MWLPASTTPTWRARGRFPMASGSPKREFRPRTPGKQRRDIYSTQGRTHIRTLTPTCPILSRIRRWERCTPFAPSTSRSSTAQYMRRRCRHLCATRRRSRRRRRRRCRTAARVYGRPHRARLRPGRQLWSRRRPAAAYAWSPGAIHSSGRCQPVGDGVLSPSTWRSPARDAASRTGRSSLFCGGGPYTKLFRLRATNHVPAASAPATCMFRLRALSHLQKQFVQRVGQPKESLRCETEPYSLDELLELWLSRGDAGLDSLDELFSEDEVELFSQLRDCREAAVGELCYLERDDAYSRGVGTFPNECKPKNRPCSFHPGASPDICQKTTRLFRSVDTPPPPACDPDCADVEPSTYGPHSVPAWERHDPPRQGTPDQQGLGLPVPHTYRYAVENGLCDGLGGVPSVDRSAAQKDFMTSGFCAKTCGFCIPCTRERSFDDIVCTDGRLNVHTSATCDTGAGCGLCLQHISPSDCPEDLDSLRRCDDASVGFGDLCVGDGACGTNPAARNCGHAVYRNVDVCVCDDLEPEEVIDRWRSGQGDLEPEKGICSTALEQSTCPDLVRRGYCRASCRACKPRTPRSPPAPAEEEAEEEAEEVEEGVSQYRLQYRLSDGDTVCADVALATGAVRCCETSPCISPMCRAPTNWSAGRRSASNAPPRRTSPRSPCAPEATTTTTTSKTAAVHEGRAHHRVRACHLSQRLRIR